MEGGAELERTGPPIRTGGFMPDASETRFHMEAASGLTLLLAEDDIFSRERLEEFLPRVVGDLMIADDVEDAPALFEHTQAEVALVGLSGDGAVGAEAVRAIRERSPDASVFILVDPDNRGQMDVAMELDADRLLARPVLPTTLLSALARAARNADIRRRIQDADDSVQLIMDTAPTYVLMAQEGEAVYVNRGMLAYLGYDNFEQFKLAGKNVGDFVSQMDEAPWEGGDDWIRAILDDPLDREHMLTIPNPRDPSGRPGTFMVAFKEFPTPGRHLLTLTDITELERERRTLRDEASTDPLTGAMNRRRFLGLMAEQEQAAMHGGSHYSLIMVDVDHFKHINDQHGHDVGDVVLKELVKLIQNNIRSSDVLCRWGGEEFMVLTPDSDHRRANRVAERLRRKLEGYDFPGVPHVVTGSFGVAEAGAGESSAACIKRVDAALYQAKESGRNKVVLSSGP